MGIVEEVKRLYVEILGAVVALFSVLSLLNVSVQGVGPDLGPAGSVAVLLVGLTMMGYTRLVDRILELVGRLRDQSGQ